MMIPAAYLTLGVVALCVLVLPGVLVRRALGQQAKRLAMAEATLAALADRAAGLESAQAVAASQEMSRLRADLARRLGDLARAQTRLEAEAAARTDQREARIARALRGLSAARRRDAQAIEALAARLTALEATAPGTSALAARLTAIERAQTEAADAASERIASLSLALDALEERLPSAPARAEGPLASDPGLAMPARVISVLGP